MQAIDRLTSSQIVALTSFIEGVQRIRDSVRWRTAFYECTRRGHFLPYVTAETAKELRDVVERFGPVVVCYLRTADVLRAGWSAADNREPPAQGSAETARMRTSA